MVINIGALKDGRDDYVLWEINQLANLCKMKGKTLKVIIESSILTRQEIERVCRIIMKTDADYIKTSTGFAEGGASIEDVRLIKEATGGRKKIKASGGIKDREFALELIGAGASRIGASAAREILFP